MSIVRFALIGFGNIGKRYKRLLAENPAAQLTGIADINTTLTTEAGDIPFYTSSSDMFETVEADVVIVATPNYLHAQHAIAALESGRHVIVEKPMALKHADAKAIEAAAAKAGKEVFVVMQNRYNPLLQWLRNIVLQGITGKVYQVKVNCYWNRDERYYTPGNWHGSKEKDGGTLFTQFSHFLDAVCWIFGPMTPRYASFYNLSHKDLIEFEDTGLIELQAGETICSFDYSTAVYNSNYEGSITVFAEKGTIRIGGTYMNHLEYANIKDYEVPALQQVADSNSYGLIKGSAGYHDALIENVIGHLLNGQPYINTPEEGAALIKLMEDMYNLHT
jgi:UDP-N-acetyl-2-amino-2-deoxyglucuronate dehydrogenase